LRHERFDLVVDLRNSAIPFLIAPRHRTRPEKIKPGSVHMMDKHLKRLGGVHAFDLKRTQPGLLTISPETKRDVNDLLKDVPSPSGPLLVIAPGSAHHTKRWGIDHFSALIPQLKRISAWPIVFVGDEKDIKVTHAINQRLSTPVIDLAGETTLIQLAEVIRRAGLVISNDSAAMHLASYLNVPVLALFGPSDPQKYGPWSSRSSFIQAPVVDEEIDINAITPEEVLARLDLNSARIFHEQRV
jgi:ADP-heptose:LPS heptosyltransferase